MSELIESRPSAEAAPARSAPAHSTFALAQVATGSILAAWCLLGVGASWHEGEYSSWGLAAAAAGFLLLLAVLLTGAQPLAPGRRLLALPATVALLAALVHPARRLMHTHGAGLVAIDVLAAATALAALTVLVVRRDDRAWRVGALLAAVTGVVTIVVVRDPHIDVWYLLQQSSAGLLHGDDMYRQHWQHSHGLQAVYPYLPLTTLLLAPFRWVLGDVRFGLLLASLLTSWQLRRLAPAVPATLALLVLVQPHWVFLVDQSWTEPLLLALLAAAIFAIDRGRPGLATLTLAAALAAKQHIVLLLPLFALWPAFGLRRTVGSAGLALVAVLPWIVAGPRDFWHDAVHANLALGVIPRALSIPSWLSRHDVTVGFWLLLAALLVTYVVAWSRAPRTPSGLALSCALVMWAVDLANKQSFFNHYTLPLGLLVIGLAAAGSPRLARKDPQP